MRSCGGDRTIAFDPPKLCVWQADGVSASVTVHYWAGAQRAAGVDTEILSAATVGELRAVLAALPARSGLDRVSAVASILVDEVPAGDTTPLSDGARVDVLPPFAGGRG